MDNADNRKSPRENLRIPLKLLVPSAFDAPSNVHLGFSFNVSEEGMGLDVAPELPLGSSSDVQVYMDAVNNQQTEPILAKLVWSESNQCGLRFTSGYESIKHLLHKPVRLNHTKVQSFYPFVNGHDVDTRQYRFFPYADKAILDFRKVVEFKNALKRGHAPQQVDEYIFGQYVLADGDLNRAAILAAHKAFQQFGLWDLERRRRVLDDIRELLIQEKENLIQLMIVEGHPRKLAEWEYSGMLTAHLPESLDYYQSQLHQVVGKYGDETLISIRRPEGVICVCPPKNAACSNSLTASFALLAGNTLIVKPPKDMPCSTIYLWRNIVWKALAAHKAPAGTVNIVLGDSIQFMNDWIESPYVKGILMFNDSEKGLEIGKRVYESGKKPILELSGNDHLLVWKDAPVEEAAESLIDCFMGSTQICMVPKKAIIHADIYEEFVRVFLQKVRQLRFGLPSDPETVLSPVLKIKEFFEHLRDAQANGATLLTGGRRVDHNGHPNESGMYLEPTVMEVPYERSADMRCIREENFFPLMPLVRVNAAGDTSHQRDENIFNAMSGMLKNNKYGLRVSIWVRHPHYLKKFIEQTHASGLLRINTRHIGFSPCLSTHGGVGFSGGPFGEMNYIWQKSSHLQGIVIRTLKPGSPAKLNVIE